MRHARLVPNQNRSAGRSSQRKYDELTRSWRGRNRTVFVVLGLLCGSVIVSSIAAARHWPGIAWTSGLFGGAALAVFVIAWISPPGWIENWQSGAWGEQATAKALAPLEKAGWIVLHDLEAGRGNVDHIAVGPGGVFLLDSKRLGGSVHVDNNGVTVRRLDDPDLSYQHPGSAHLLSLARRTHERVFATSRLRTWVTPVMVIWAEFPQETAELDRCTYVHGDRLADWLRSRPQAIAPSRVDQIAQAVEASWGRLAKPAHPAP